MTSAKDWVWSDLYVPVSSAALGRCKGLLKTQLSESGFYKDGGQVSEHRGQSNTRGYNVEGELEATSLRGKASR